MAILYNIGTGLARTCFTLFSRWSVEGREAVLPWGRLLVVANHQSNADPPVVAASLPRRVYFMAKRGLFANGLVNSILAAVGVYPLDRDGRDTAALQWALQVLEEDKALALFPEGTRGRGGMRKGVSGVAYLALKSQAPILPIGITGTENIPGLLRVAMPLCRIHVRIGQPFTLPLMEGNVSRPQLEELTDMILGRVAQLLPPEYRGVYGGQRSPSSKPEQTEHPPQRP